MKDFLPDHFRFGNFIEAKPSIIRGDILSENSRWFKVTFLSPSWRSLSLWKGRLTIPKRSQRTAKEMLVFRGVKWSQKFCFRGIDGWLMLDGSEFPWDISSIYVPGFRLCTPPPPVASTVLDHVTAGLCLLSMYIYMYIYICIIIYIYMIFWIHVAFGMSICVLASSLPGSLLQVLWSWYLATFWCRVCFALFLCASCSAFFGFFGAFGVFGVVGAFGVFGLFGVFGVFVRFRRFRRCRLWGMEIYVLASPLPGSLFIGPVMMVFGYFVMPCVFCALAIL